MKFLIALLILSSQIAFTAPMKECSKIPVRAIIELPNPLKSWGQIICTPYGYIITNKDGWIWSNPGSYSPVMIPSQMIRSNPEKLGSNSYFTKIEIVALESKASESAIKTFESFFDKSEIIPTVYSLNVISVSGKSLSFQFFDYGDSQWGMWCNKECNPKSAFMILNMEKEP